MKKCVVINVVGLTSHLIGPNTPFLESYLKRHRFSRIKPVLPAVTCTAQSTYLTGLLPEDHGIVGNGWYFKEECEVKFWRQSNKLVQAPKLWEILKAEDRSFTCANLFWWYNMYSSVDYSVTPRPNYLADGRKIPDCYPHPPKLRTTLQERLGTFPLFQFWGPKTSIKSTKWIADAAITTDTLYNPTLSLVYLPHLDYNLQRYGNNQAFVGKDLQEIDTVIQDLVTYFEGQEATVILLSEYGITNVEHPVHLNRVLRDNDYLAIREERGLELLDAGASVAFAVADHQIAHVYINDDSKRTAIRDLLQQTKGVAQVLEGDTLGAQGLSHERSGDFVVVADQNSWFTYYYWFEDKKAPDFARTVDIHKKPGYDPVELFTDPKDKLVFARVLWKLFKKKLGFRTLLDIIPLDANLVKGSHGCIPEDPQHWPIFAHNASALKKEELEATEVFNTLLQLIRNT
ncbi:MAG: nucleotide pyrophosphatase/phosphodiesterase family protein [Bacteroidota bacterium]